MSGWPARRGAEGITLDRLTKIYPNGVRAVDGVSLEIHPGEFMVLVGPSGCGKSTLLRMIAGLESIDEGSIIIGGRDVTDQRPEARDIAMVFQNYALYPHMTTRQNLAFGLKMRHAPKALIKKQVADVAQVLGLQDLLDRKPAQLSGGQRQRVAIGRAMVREPAAFLMDEPLSNLDAKLRVAMRAELARLHDRLAVTTVYVTHDQVEAMTLGQRVAVMRDGLLQQCDVPQALFDRPANLFVAAFIGSPEMNLVAAQVGHGAVEFAGLTLSASREFLPEPGRQVILGIRPQDLSIATKNDTARIPVSIEIVEELGADSIVLFGLDAAPVVAEAVVAAHEATTEDKPRLLADDTRALWSARLTGRNYVRAGATTELAVDMRHLHFFEPTTGRAIETRAVAETVNY